MEDIRKSIKAINLLSETDLKLPLIHKDLSVMEHLLETLRANNANKELGGMLCYNSFPGYKRRQHGVKRFFR